MKIWTFLPVGLFVLGLLLLGCSQNAASNGDEPQSDEARSQPTVSVDAELEVWKALPGEGGYHKLKPWAEIGECPPDQRLSKLADLYLAGDAARRQMIGDYFDAKSTQQLDELWMYVRRVGKLIRTKDDTIWLRRGLAIAVVDSGRVDYRDTIVSLVLLRYAAERVGIETRPFFDAAITMARPEHQHIFKNARDHAPGDLSYTVKAFGPPDWIAEIQKQDGAR